MSIVSGIDSTSQNTFSIGDGYTAFKCIYANTATLNKSGIRYNTTLNYFETSNNGTDWSKLLGTNDIVPIYVNYTTKSTNTYEQANTIVKNPVNTITQYQVYNSLRRSDGYTHLSICDFAVSSYNNLFRFVGESLYSLTSEQCCNYYESEDVYSSTKYLIDGYTGILTFQYKSSIAGVVCNSVISPLTSQNSSTIYTKTWNRSADWWNGKTCSEWNLTYNKLIESQSFGDGYATVNYYTNNSGTAAVDIAYEGAVFANNKVYFVPYRQGPQAKWHYVDTITNNVFAYNNSSGTTPNDYAYNGGCLTPDGKIYLAPSNQANGGTKWHYINTNNNTVIAYTAGTNSSSAAYIGAVYAPNNRVYFIPSGQANNANGWHYINTITGAATLYPQNSGRAAVISAYAGGVLTPNGRIYMAPSAQGPQAYWHYIDTNTGNVIAYPNNSGIPAISNAYHGAVLTPNNRVYFIPNYQTTESNLHYVDLNTGNVIAYNPGLIIADATYARGSCYSPDGKIYFIPTTYNYNLNIWYYIDYKINKFVGYQNNLVSITSSSATSYGGGVLAPNGNIYLAPRSTANQNSWWYIQTNCELPLSNNICTNPMFNKL